MAAKTPPRSISSPGHGEVYQVVFLEVQLHGAAGPLHNHQFVSLVQAAEALHHLPDQAGLFPVVVPGGIIAIDLAVDDDLGAHLGGGLEQYGVHVHMGCEAGGHGLDHLGPPHFPALRGDKTVEGHVLGLKGDHPDALLAEDAAEASRHQAFAHVGTGTQDHERSVLHGQGRRAFIPPPAGHPPGRRALRLLPPDIWPDSPGG